MSQFSTEDIMKRFKQLVSKDADVEHDTKGPGSIQSDQVVAATILGATLHPYGYAQEETALRDVAANADMFAQIIVANVVRNDGALIRSFGSILICAFGGPPVLTEKPHALNALQATKGISIDIDSFNQQRSKQSESAINAGYGLVYGKVLGGNRGSGQFKSYELVGGSVYLALALSNIARDGQCFANAEFLTQISAATDSYPIQEVKLTNGTIHTVYRIIP